MPYLNDDFADDPDHSDPAYWRHCAEVERLLGSYTFARELDELAAELGHGEG